MRFPAGVLVVCALLAGCYGVDYRYLARGGGGAPVAQRCGPMPFRINPHGAAGEWQLDAAVHNLRKLHRDSVQRAKASRRGA